MYIYVYIHIYLCGFNKLFYIFPPSYPLRRYGPRLRNNNNSNSNNNNYFITWTTGLHPSRELFTAGAPTPTSLGELVLIKGLADQTNPSYPTLCLQDTTLSWSSDDQATN